MLPYDAHAESKEPPKGGLLAIFAVALVDMLGFGLVIPLLPFYARQFMASPVQVTLLFSIFSICQFIATPMLGSLSDRIGRKPILFVSLIGNAIGYVLLGWATQHQWTDLTVGLLTLYLSRIIAGLTAGNISAAQAYISDITTPQNRTKGMGVLGAAFGIGFSIGPAAGGMLAHYFTPAAPAWAAAGAALTALLLCGLLLKESRQRNTGSSASYLHPGQFRPLLSNAPLMTINTAWFIAMASFVAVDSAIVMFLADVYHYDSRQVAYYFLVVGITIIITQGGLVGRLNKHFGEWNLCVFGLALNGVGSILTAATAWHTTTGLLYGSAIAYAFGRSLFQPTISALVSHHSDSEHQGLSFGFFQAVGSLARIAGPLGAGLIYSYHHTWPWFIGALALWFTAILLAILHGYEKRKHLPV